MMCWQRWDLRESDAAISVIGHYRPLLGLTFGRDQTCDPLCAPTATSASFQPRPFEHNEEVDSSQGMEKGWGGISRCCAYTHTLTSYTAIHNACIGDNMALRSAHRANPPSPSVPASPGIPRSSRAVAASGARPSRSAAWRERPPLSVAGWAPTEDKGALSNSGGVTRLPRWDSAVAIIQQLAAVACCVWGVGGLNGSCANWKKRGWYGYLMSRDVSRAKRITIKNVS